MPITEVLNKRTTNWARLCDCNCLVSC